METPIDYWYWPQELIYRTEFNNFLFESLSPSSDSMLEKRMENAFPGFSGYVERRFPPPPGGLLVSDAILGKYGMDELKERANAFSYNLYLPENSHLIVMKPDHAPSAEPRDAYYVHISRADLLDINGIRCKSSGRFEEYQPRIYMIPLYDLVDASRTDEEQYDMLVERCTAVAARFNSVYLKTGKIDDYESYYVYLVRLPETYRIFDDPATPFCSVYTESNIPASQVRKVAFLETPGKPER